MGSRAIQVGIGRIWASLPSGVKIRAYRTLAATIGRLPGRLQARARIIADSLHASHASVAKDYPVWIKLYEQTDDVAREAASAAIAGLPDQPLISVLMPVYNPSPNHLRQAIDSVREQFYPRWELCIADDKSTDPAVGEILREAQAADTRIKIAWRETNGHISAASNSALALASGAFIALLDHDDLLSPVALYEVVAKLAESPTADIIYSDEDHIDDQSRRSTPFMKPDWNLELMLAQNLISHLGVYRRSLVQRLGGFRTGFEGSQDYDLALRTVAATTPEQIIHIPKVLYHWRRNSRAGAYSEGFRQQCENTARKAVRAFLNAAMPNAQVVANPAVAAWNRVIYPVPSPEPLVSVIIPTRNQADLLARVMDGLLRRTDYASLEVIIVDNESTEASALTLLETLSEDHRVSVLACPGPFNYPALNNLAARHATGSLILLLNNDIDMISPGWLHEMVSHAVRPGIGAVGAKLLYPDNTVQHGGVTVGRLGVAGHQYLNVPASDRGYFGQLQLARDVMAVTGACLMVSREAYWAVGGLDAVSLPVAFNDIDFCLKLARKGYRNIWTPYAELYHLESASRGSDEAADKAARFRREVACMRERWGHCLDHDPYWSPNLSLHSHKVTLSFPPRSVPNRSESRRPVPVSAPAVVSRVRTIGGTETSPSRSVG